VDHFESIFYCPEDINKKGITAVLKEARQKGTLSL